MIPTLKLYGDIDSQQFVTLEGGTPANRTFVLGDQPKISFELCQLSDLGVKIRNDVPIRSIRASLGYQFKIPTSGTFELIVSGLTSATIPFDDDGTAIHALVGDSTVQATELIGDSEWRIYWNAPVGDATASQIADLLAAGVSDLLPRSFIRVRPIASGTYWTTEIKLIQSPFAFADTWDRVLPDEPSVENIRDGNTGGVGEPSVNAVQAIVVPTDYLGTYFINWDYRVTRVIGTDEGPTQIEDALNAMYIDGVKRFKVTNPVDTKAYVEFVGPLADGPQDALTITVDTFEAGKPTFLFDMNTVEFDAALRAGTTGKLENVPFEIEVEVVPTEADIGDDEVAGRILTFQALATCTRQLIYPELGTTQLINWLIPPEPSNYVPFTPGQVITGTQYYSSVRGNGSATSFTLTHNLATDNIAAVLVRANTSPGALYTEGGEYTVSFTNSNVLVVTWLGAAPATDALLITVATAGPASAFAAHTHSIAEVTGLQDALDAIAARLTAIEDLLPYTTPALDTVDTGENAIITIPDKSWQYPGRIDPKAKLDDGPVTLKHYGALLPAAHDSAEADSATLPAYGTVDTVFNATAAFFVPGGYGHKGFTTAVSDKLATDTRQVYAVNIGSSGSKSYFPEVFEKELFLFAVSDTMLKLGKEFSLTFDLDLQLIGSETNAQYVFLLEYGTADSQTSPATTTENLSAVTWSSTPAIDHRIIVSNARVKHRLGFAVLRSVVDVMTSNKLINGAWTAAADEPTASSFMVRGRLARFDTENNVSGAKGSVWGKLSKVTTSL